MNGNTRKDAASEHGDPAVERAAAAIRERSAAAQLISESEILSLLRDEDRPQPEAKTTDESLSVLLARSVRENDDLQRLSARESNFYYSAHHMTESYAELLLRKLDGPLRLIAETVRHNADTYGRPVPIDIFEQAPFDLSRDQILEFLAGMAGMEGYHDIKMTTTSASGIYLFSRTHLEPDHAAMLAEWLDVGQTENP